MKYFKDELTSLLNRLLKFKDNFAFLLLVYAPYLGIVAGLMVILHHCCIWLELPYKFTSPIIRTILSVSPIIPSLIIWRGRDDFGGESGLTDGIMDACFSIWTIVILIAWMVN